MENVIHTNYRILFALLMGAIVILSFYVGILYGKQGNTGGVILMCTDEVLTSLRIDSSSLQTQAKAQEESLEPATSSSRVKGMYAGSKNGTKYYTPGCSGLDRIKPENLIWFQNAEDATLQGYSAAAC